VPTVAEYLPRVQQAARPGANRTYGTYWNRMAQCWSDRRLDEVLVTDIEALMREAAAKAVPRRRGPAFTRRPAPRLPPENPRQRATIGDNW
jgi:hypothetical protein